MKTVKIYMCDGRLQTVRAESVEPVLDCGYFILRCGKHELYIIESEVEAVEILDESNESYNWLIKSQSVTS